MLDARSFSGVASAESQVYGRFRRYLSRLGFTLYPGEFDCVYSEHPLVDIAARMGAYYWAFEYKSQHDSISRGVEQVGCYRRWFDYVVLVSERTLDHRKSDNYWKLRRIGAGVWFYDPKKDGLFVKVQPVIHSPEAVQRRLVARRFSALKGSDRSRSSTSPPQFQCDLRAFPSG